MVRQIWWFLKLHSKLTYIKCLVDPLKGLLFGRKVLQSRCIGSGSRQSAIYLRSVRTITDISNLVNVTF